MDAFVNTLIKMSLRGIVIILVVLLVRFLLKKLGISHKYILGLWAMVFLFFIFPWKLSLPVGFWNNANIPEEVRVITENLSGAGKTEVADDEVGVMNSSGGAENITAGMLTVPMGDTVEPDAAKPVEPAEQNRYTVESAEQDKNSVEPAEQNRQGINEVKNDSLSQKKIGVVLCLFWLVGLSGFIGHMLYSYYAIKRKLQVSVLYQDNIWWTEDIDMPMVFGLVWPQIYLPTSMEPENLAYVIAHEKMHIKRKDGLFKMITYIICLIHWFNPFIWIAYFLFGSDLEKACDEEVIRGMGKEKRKEYAYALLHIAAENGRKKRRVFVAPICFDEGNVKSRIKNVMKYKYTLPWIGAVVVIVILSLSVLFLTEAKEPGKENPEQETVKTNESGEGTSDETDILNSDVATDEETDVLPFFFVADLDTLQIEDNFSLEDYYITSRYIAGNHYYIDKDGVLWGTGNNQYGQLGTGTYGYDEKHEEPVRIAEHVVSVDASSNGYFCIYLTEGGELYGIGENYVGILLGKGSESITYSKDNYQRVTEPVLLMTDVAYARAGMECIVALKKDQTAYWWGQYAPTTSTHADASLTNYWKVEEDASNPVKMLAVEPMKIMEHCRYITTGSFTGAAISETGELYTWGFNIYGQCGTPVTEDDFVRTPVKVMDDVKMVWSDRIYFSDSSNSSSEFVRWETDYRYVTFVMQADDTLMAAGVDLGAKEKITAVNGDIVDAQTHRYSDVFVPVQAVEYSINNILKILSELEFGMSLEEAEEILNSADLHTFRVDESVYGEGYNTGLCALYNQYHCYFNSQDELVKITIQEGGSRDGRFALGMSLSDLEKAVEEAGGTLTKSEKSAEWILWDGWVYQDQEQQIQYEFTVYKGSVTSVHEIAMRGNSGQ